VLVSSWIYENVGKTKRVFNYVEPFPAEEPTCQPGPFTRAFQHDDVLVGVEMPDERAARRDAARTAHIPRTGQGYR